VYSERLNKPPGQIWASPVLADGKLYFSIGDRGAHVPTKEGGLVDYPDEGAVYRANLDGTGLEIVHRGLRNPQELVFDEHGNLFTGDNDSDQGDQERLVYLVEGGDSGWRVGYQFMERPYSRGPFNQEKLWYPHFEGQAAYIVPPITNIATGPSGVAYYPGTGLPEKYAEHFFLADFHGSDNSRVHSFKLRPKGASFELVDADLLVKGPLATDVKFGVDGGVYVSDWVKGWTTTGHAARG
jgi:quinoprotein glucose dehydrogenase